MGGLGRLNHNRQQKKEVVEETTTSIKKTILFKTALNPTNLPKPPKLLLYQTIYIDTIYKKSYEKNDRETCRP